jgi:microcystin-dependent protein
MAEAFIGEIRMFGGNFAPMDWAFCNGQLLSIAQNTVLFSLLGTTYGGDGKTTFALPNLQGATPMHQGAGPGLTPRTLGETGGAESVTLTEPQLPNHAHVANASSSPGTLGDPTNAIWGAGGRGTPAVYSTVGDTPMSIQSLTPAGGSQPHNNRQPYQAVSFIIALQGIFPPRS